MRLFGKGKSGGLMNVIRCDQSDYLVWKWVPENQKVNSTSRENSIRFGSSIRVKPGEVAVFMYKHEDGSMCDYIEGGVEGYDKTLRTANLPVLAGILGTAFGGESPFQAEVYYINLQQNNKLEYLIPYFDVLDPRFPEMPIPVSMKGSFVFNITDYKRFIQLNRLVDFSLDRFREQINDALVHKIKNIVNRYPIDSQTPLVQLELRINELCSLVEREIKDRLADFGVNLKYFDINNLHIDKEHPFFKKLFELTAGATARASQVQVDYNVESLKQQGASNIEIMKAKTDATIQNLKDVQRINADNIEQTMRIQREESQYMQHLQTQQEHMAPFTASLQAEVLKSGLQNIGTMGNIPSGNGDGGMNPAALMTGMAVGGSLGQQMVGMMNSLNAQVNGQAITPPPLHPESTLTPPPLHQPLSVYIAQGNSPTGPFDENQLMQKILLGELTKQTKVWIAGMAQWDIAGNVQVVNNLIDSITQSHASSNIVTPPII